MKVKSIILILAAFVLGPLCFWSGIHDYRNSQRLAAQGRTATAEVLDRVTQYRSRGANRYYLSVQFQTETAQDIRMRVPVTQETYSHANTGGTTTVRYLPSNPNLCAVGETVNTWMGSFVSGSVLLLSGCVLMFAARARSNTRKAAVKVAGHVAGLCETHYEYASVNANDFGHLDLGWYGASQQWLEKKGFGLLGDEENLTFRRTSKGNRTLLRTMLSRDGTCLAYIYHFKPNTTRGASGGEGFRILELQTHFANGAFLTTSNAEAAGKLNSPPGIDALHLTATASREEVFAAHTRRLEAFLSANPGIAPGLMTSLDDVHRVQNALQAIKAAYRGNTGITKEELQRIAGSRLAPCQIDALHAEVVKVRCEQQKAA